MERVTRLRRWLYTHESHTLPTLAGSTSGWRTYLLGKSVSVSRSLYRNSVSVGTLTLSSSMASKVYPYFIAGPTLEIWKTPTSERCIRLSVWWGVGGIRLYLTRKPKSRSKPRNTGLSDESDVGTKST